MGIVSFSSFLCVLWTLLCEGGRGAVHMTGKEGTQETSRRWAKGSFMITEGSISVSRPLPPAPQRKPQSGENTGPPWHLAHPGRQCPSPNVHRQHPSPSVSLCSNAPACPGRQSPPLTPSLPTPFPSITAQWSSIDFGARLSGSNPGSAPGQVI